MKIATLAVVDWSYSGAPATIMVSAVATLVALTQEAEHALGGIREVPLTRFPVNFGRHRSPGSEHTHEGSGEEGHDPAPLNDVYLIELESSSHRHVSGAHFAIEYSDNQFFLVDRGSACGTIVAGNRIGGNRKGGRTELRDGDEVVVGTSRSPFVFRFGIVDFDNLGTA